MSVFIIPAAADALGFTHFHIFIASRSQTAFLLWEALLPADPGQREPRGRNQLGGGGGEGQRSTEGSCIPGTGDRKCWVAGRESPPPQPGLFWDRRGQELTS